MPAFNDPGKLEAAMSAIVGALTLPLYSGESSLVVNTGQDDDALTLPSVVLSVISGGEEVVKGTGIMRSRAVARVTSGATIGVANHQTRAATVFDGLFQDNAPAAWSAAGSDFHVYEVNFTAPEPARKDPRDDGSFVWVSEMEVEVVWCGSDIS
jgi:hypothetical protein